ncbi:MAG: RHS repeat-associated core domain-containing protein [Sphingopyxis sp.]|uniref:RHS repeat-associated core domain-containing protein n=1 Tax=Sphingopyxis sp. TaxID=1908224 RepID=UPI001A5E42C3|nr:RHS repeat-associated core domain-containing protein [Sphingopyxis sp.]MBL9064773.1 RHS repeat-associated core domain-containing protein [Sphingopyxis sp.]
MLYNGFDERVGLTTTLGGSAVEERRFAYDAGHRIVGEYGATTSGLRAEYIWLLPEVGDGSAFGGDDGLGGYMPLAVAVPDGGTSKLHWVQGNHLGTPVVTTDASGAITPTGFARIGFPGQVEQHADLYYNYYRDYDPTLGRYVQADPIGLGGDVNPYVYAKGNPLNEFDSDGLRARSQGRPPVRAPVPRTPILLAPPPIPVFLNPNGPRLSPQDRARLERQKIELQGKCAKDYSKPFWAIFSSYSNDDKDSCVAGWIEETEGYCTRFRGVRYRRCLDRANDRLHACKHQGGIWPPPNGPDRWSIQDEYGFRP